MFVPNINVRLSQSRFYIFLRWYDYMSFEKYNSTKSFMIVGYFLTVIRITRIFDYPM